MDSPMLEGSNSESASRRTDIPGQDDQELTKKQAVAYPYHYYYPGYMMGRGMNPYYHYAAAAAVSTIKQCMLHDLSVTPFITSVSSLRDRFSKGVLKVTVEFQCPNFAKKIFLCS